MIQQDVICPNCGAEMMQCKTLREWIELWTKPKDVSTPEREAVKPKRRRKVVAEEVIEGEGEDGC